MVAVYFLYTLGCFLAALFNISSFLSIEKKIKELEDISSFFMFIPA